MAKKRFLVYVLLSILGLTLISLACGSSNGIPRNAAVVELVANTSLTPWLDEAVSRFNNAEFETPSGKQAFIQLTSVEAGQVVVDITNGSPLPDLWIPDSDVWVNLLADKGQANFQANCTSTAQSPLVIAMWQPIAEGLGWPGRSLGWLDISSLAADPSAWAYYSGGQFGEKLNIGHTHPGLSDSGVSTLLAVVQAAQSKTEAVTPEDIQNPIVQASVSSFEGTVTWFSPSTDKLGATMRQRGIDYLGASIMYESTVVNYGIGEINIVPIYPFEGTFMANHPACLNSNSNANTQEASKLFRDYLLSEEGQQLAIQNGLRPVSNIPITAPLDAAHGVDLNKPAIVFNPPSVESLYAVQEVWQSARKEVNLVMLLDTSASMRGRKIEGMRQAAIQFVQQMGNEDYLTIITFSSNPSTVIDHKLVGEERQNIINAITNLNATGRTAMYDAIAQGGRVIDVTKTADTTNAMVLLSDGQDTASYQHSFNEQLINLAKANDTTVFTIAYGSDADEDILFNLASQANGNFYLGNEANIDAIYQEMSAAFGGSVGIGR